eukprot:257727-Prymnesium_polylepis.1
MAQRDARRVSRRAGGGAPGRPQRGGRRGPHPLLELVHFLEPAVVVLVLVEFAHAHHLAEELRIVAPHPLDRLVAGWRPIERVVAVERHLWARRDARRGEPEWSYPRREATPRRVSRERSRAMAGPAAPHASPAPHARLARARARTSRWPTVRAPHLDLARGLSDPLCVLGARDAVRLHVDHREPAAVEGSAVHLALAEGVGLPVGRRHPLARRRAHFVRVELQGREDASERDHQRQEPTRRRRACKSGGGRAERAAGG